MDKLHPKPVDRVAARVIFPGVHYEPTRKNCPVKQWEIPPKTAAWSESTGFDLTGMERGRMTVVGYLGYGRWLCRCSCGMYEPRRSKAIKNKNNHDACQNCLELATRRRHYAWIKFGKNLPIEKFL